MKNEIKRKKNIDFWGLRRFNLIYFNLILLALNFAVEEMQIEVKYRVSFDCGWTVDSLLIQTPRAVLFIIQSIKTVVAGMGPKLLSQKSK